jgi:hypothetical protein
MSMMDYVIGGMDRSFKLKLFRMFHAAEAAGLSPGITSAFRDDYRQSMASGLKAASNRSYHGGSLRGGYGHGLAADVVSVEGGTRNQRFASFGNGLTRTGWNSESGAHISARIRRISHRLTARNMRSTTAAPNRRHRTQRRSTKKVKGVATRDHSRHAQPRELRPSQAESELSGWPISGSK